MQVPEHYTSDVLFFFDGKPLELSLYQLLSERMAEVLPDDVSVKVQKNQISFYAPRLFAAASLPVHRKKAVSYTHLDVYKRQGPFQNVPRVGH